METNHFMIDQLLDQWENKIRETTELFVSLGRESAMEPVSPGKNRVIYLLGHLVAVHDLLFEALELGGRSYGQYDQLFLTPQHASNAYPDYGLLLKNWISVNDALSPRLRQFTAEDWKSKHHYVSEADFLAQPKRNKFNVFTSRNAHLFHHAGQLALIRINPDPNDD
jgi:hypothetical protein